jgi:hypothetical protein
MKFTTYYSITRDDADDWFDPDLDADTKLFVDPFLMFTDKDPRWAGAHDRLVAFFNEILTLTAATMPALPGSLAHRRLINQLRFPEPSEFCLGLCELGTHGAGAGAGLGQLILRAAHDTIEAGRTDIRHFEELALFGEGFGADRISDIVCNVLKAEFITYTQDVAHRHGVPLHTRTVANARWDIEPALHWRESDAAVPINPVDSYQGPVLLVPSRFLRRIPTLDIESYGHWSCNNLNLTLRDDLNFALAEAANTPAARKKIYRELLRRHPSTVEGFVKHNEDNPPDPYDLERDPDLVQVESLARKFLPSMHVARPTTATEVRTATEGLINGFVRHVEDRDGWQLLWESDKKFRNERKCQQVFRAIVQLMSDEIGLDMSPETNNGNGPLDLKFSVGADAKTIVELKRASSSSLVRNVVNQVPSYLRAESTSSAFMVILQYDDAHCEPAFTAKIEGVLNDATAASTLQYRIVWVDARRRLTASRIGQSA